SGLTPGAGPIPTEPDHHRNAGVRAELRRLYTHATREEWRSGRAACLGRPVPRLLLQPGCTRIARLLRRDCSILRPGTRQTLRVRTPGQCLGIRRACAGAHLPPAFLTTCRRRTDQALRYFVIAPSVGPSDSLFLARSNTQYRRALALHLAYRGR